MWIRSQNKEILTDANKIYIECDFTDYDCKHKTYFIKADCILGQYSSKEKALKVLDMIQKQIANCSEHYGKAIPVTPYDQWKESFVKTEFVFQMPEDYQVVV